MKLLPRLRRKSARALIIQDGKLLVFLRKRYSRRTGEWIEYFSIPGGGIEKGEEPEQAVVRELFEEMGIGIKVDEFVAHVRGKRFEHYVYTAHITEGTPSFMEDSEEAFTANEYNQFIVHWADIDTLNREKLRYYGVYCDLIHNLGKGIKHQPVLRIED